MAEMFISSYALLAATLCSVNGSCFIEWNKTKKKSKNCFFVVFVFTLSYDERYMKCGTIDYYYLFVVNILNDTSTIIDY